MPRSFSSIGAVAVLALATSCSRDVVPTQPVHVAPGLATGAQAMSPSEAALPECLRGTGIVPSRVPMALGDTWVYDRDYVVYQVSENGDRTPVFTAHSTITDFMVCADSVNGNRYAYRRSTEVSPESGTYLSWVGQRQDLRGLYELDVNITEPPACDPQMPAAIRRGVATDFGARVANAAIARLPAGPQGVTNEGMIHAVRSLVTRAARFEESMRPRGGIRTGEIQRLGYPLRVGQQWYVRNQPPDLVITSKVLAHEVCVVPAGSWPAAKVDLVWTNVFGPNDRAASWYGKPGLLRFQYHFEGSSTPGGPNDLVIENDQRLTHFDLVGDRRLADRDH
jgi:hypothetical protein